MHSAPHFTGDSPELEDLFDSIAYAPLTQQAPQPSPGTDTEQFTNMYAEIGMIVRRLHDALRQLGYLKSLERWAAAIPDAKNRLNFIFDITVDAAERVLNATDIAQPIQNHMGTAAANLAARWEHLYAGKLSLEEFKQLATYTREFLCAMPLQVKATNEQLIEIVLAQEFQDLTGQVIKCLTNTVQALESELLEFLVKFSSGSPMLYRTQSLAQVEPLEPAPAETVADQQQVDDLLSSLGF